MSQILTLPNAAPGDGETLSDQIFKKIQAAIVKGEMAPGSKISEPELARIHGVSRGRCARRCTAWKARGCWCACRTPARGWCR